MIKWHWFLGGKKMFWFSIITFFVFVSGFILTYVIDPTTQTMMKVRKMDTTSIETISTQYVESLGIVINKPIVYRFVRYNYTNKNSDKELLGTFHEWNGKYYIDISLDLYNTSSLKTVVIHETRHMIVSYLSEQDVVNLSKYTEEIAQEKNSYYNNLFDSGVYLLKSIQNTGEK